MKAAQFWNTNNVSCFRGYDVRNGGVDMTKEEFIDYLDEMYDTVEVCGLTYSQGTALEALDPVAFRLAKGEHESHLQSELEDQLSCENSDDITFIDGDEYELED